MGYLSVVRGEYVARVRLAEGEDPPPPGMAREDPSHPRLAALREMLPAEAQAPGARMGRVRALTRTLVGRDAGQFRAIVPESAFRPGANEIEVFLVSGKGERASLVRVGST